MFYFCIGHALSLSSSDYIDALIPVEKNDNSIEALLPANVVSMSKLKLMSLSDQIRVILKDAKVVNFNKILELLNDKSIPNEKV